MEERHRLIIAEMLDNILADKKIDIKIALAWSLNAKNSLQNCHRFSPCQLSIGMNPILPCSFSDLPPALHHEATTDTLRQNLEVLHMACEAFIKAENAERLRRDARTNKRFANDPVCTISDVVYFKRVDNKKWHGPGTVIGQIGSKILIKQGSYYLKVHICRVMHVKKQRDSKENLAKSNISQTKKPKDSESNNIRSRKTANEPLASDSNDLCPPVTKKTSDLEQSNRTITKELDQTDSPLNDSILSNSSPEGRNRSIFDLCNILANSFTDKAHPTDESSTKPKAIRKDAIVKTERECRL